VVPADVAAAWGFDANAIAVLAGGLINQTYVVGDRRAVLQRLHPVFAGPVNLDLEAVTDHLAAKRMVTPRLIRTLDGRAWVDADNGVWRALTWVDGETVHSVPAPAWADVGGRLVGRFHRAVADLVHDYVFVRAGVHDTAAHLARLRDRVAASSGPDVELGVRILAAADALPPLPATPMRHVHGDLKISNLMFTRDPLEARCLVDLDTFGRGTMAFELGDAMRSWCNPHGEDAGSVAFDLPIFEAAMRGFLAVAGDIVTADERRSIVVGLETVCIELAARFAVDVFDDRYFGWDPARFASRRDHNRVRAGGQLALGLAVRAQRDAALAIALDRAR
jgi:Ser/Thr protein kinase RdoA (MazF antagonist)